MWMEGWTPEDGGQNGKWVNMSYIACRSIYTDRDGMAEINSANQDYLRRV